MYRAESYAVGEAVAHINHLVLTGRMHREEIQGINSYYCRSDK